MRHRWIPTHSRSLGGLICAVWRCARCRWLRTQPYGNTGASSYRYITEDGEYRGEPPACGAEKEE